MFNTGKLKIIILYIVIMVLVSGTVVIIGLIATNYNHNRVEKEIKSYEYIMIDGRDYKSKDIKDIVIYNDGSYEFKFADGTKIKTVSYTLTNKEAANV